MRHQGFRAGLCYSWPHKEGAVQASASSTRTASETRTPELQITGDTDERIIKQHGNKKEERAKGGVLTSRNALWNASETKRSSRPPATIPTRKTREGSVTWEKGIQIR